MGKDFFDNCQVWAQMTDENDHGGVLVSIARYFKLPDFAEKFVSINMQHDKLGYLSYDLLLDRNENMLAMLQTIRNKYGENIWYHVNRCL